VRAWTPSGWRPRSRGLMLSVVVCALAFGLLADAPAASAGAAVARSPMESAVSTSGGSWVILPMGDLSDQKNTFWELFHATPGTSDWSLVTPPGVADNGGLVAGASAGSVVVAILPSGLLRFSPLALSSDGGKSWGPLLLPAGLAALPDALAYGAASPGAAIALTTGGRALSATGNLSSWSRLVSAAGLAPVSPSCGVTALDAAAILPTGAPVIATGCRRGGQVGVFTRSTGSWQSIGLTLGGSLRGSTTTVLRLEVTGSTTTVLVSARRAGHRALVVLWRTGSAPWTESAPLALGAGGSVLSSSVSAGGALAVILGSPRGGRVAFDIASGGRLWAPLPRLPHRTTALALPATPMTLNAEEVDAFTVDGGSLGVFALTPSGTTWVRVQSSEIPLSYGSSG